MLKNIIKIIRIAVCAFISTYTLTVYSESIEDWPNHHEYDGVPYINVFKDLFSSSPQDFSRMELGLLKCDIDSDKLSRLSGINEDAVGSQYSSLENTSVSVDVDVDELFLMSTAEGCQEFKSTSLERTADKSVEYYQVPSSYIHPFIIYADYSTEIEMSQEINGEDYDTEINLSMVSYSLYRRAKKPHIKGMNREILVISDYGGDSAGKVQYTMNLVADGDKGQGLLNLVLSRHDLTGDFVNSIMAIEKLNSGGNRIVSIGNASFSDIHDGKMHGLMINENYLYRTDKAQNPLSYSCHDMGEAINVFKVSGFECIEKTDADIGKQDVYVSQLYQYELDRKRIEEESLAKLAEIKAGTDKAGLENSLAYIFDSSNENKQTAEQLALQKKKDEFIQKQKNSKCGLSNENWVYLGSQCENGLATGDGESEDKQGLLFKGKFSQGKRTSGEIHQNGEMIFSGNFKQDKPDGNAICLHEGEYEECRFFRGKRIDTLYKLRKENSKNLAKMEALQKENQYTAQSNTKQDSGSNILVDAVEKEAAKRAASFIFDSFF